MPKAVLNISDISATSLITLYARAQESQTANPILHDPQAVTITKLLTPELAESPHRYHQDLAKGHIDPRLVVHIALRAKQFDWYTNQFLQKQPDGVVVNIGCGFDTRFYRVNNGQFTLFDLDFPTVIAVKQQLLSPTERYHFVASSVLNLEWLTHLKAFKDHPILFLAEGVFMYLSELEVKNLICTLQAAFPGSELVCEMFNAFWLKQPFKWMIDYKLQKALQFGQEATFKFGIKDGRELEQWYPGLTFLDEWSYVDEPEERLGNLKYMKHIPLLRKTQWTVHYQL